MSHSLGLRVGLLHFTAPPIVGGVESIVGQQATALAARGHRPTVFAGRGRFRRRGVEFHRFPALDSKYPPLLRLNEELRRGCVSPRFEALTHQLEGSLAPLLSSLDVCIVHNALTLHFNLPLTAALHRLAASGRSCGLVAWCHDLAWTNPLYQPLMRDAYPWLLLRSAAPRTRYVVVSEDRRASLGALVDFPLDRIGVIPAGVDLHRKWSIGPATARLLREHRLLDADPFLLLPARITRRKNIEYAIRVVGELRRCGWRPRLLVTGPRGPHDPASIAYVRELEALICELRLGDQVVLLQTRPAPGGDIWRPTDAMMDDLYRAADLVLFPSAQEGFGIPILEAGAVGAPLFCSDIPPHREIAGRDASFFGLDEQPGEVARRIGQFMHQDARFALRRRVKQEYNWDGIVDDKLVPLLQEVADAPGMASAGEPTVVGRR